MSLTLETSEKQKPIILIYGNHALVPYLLEEYSSDFKIAYIGNHEWSKGEHFYKIPTANVQFIKSLEEKIDYAVIFLSDKSDKDLISSFMDKVVSDAERTAIIIDLKNLDFFYDVLLAYKNTPGFNFLFVGDVFSEIAPLNETSPVAKIIGSAKITHSITIPQSLEGIFTIYYKDAILGINHVLFGPKKKEAFYYLFYSEPQTVNSIAYILRRVEQDLEIHYRTSEEPHPAKSHSQLSKEIKTKTLIEPAYLDKYLIGFEKSLENFQTQKEVGGVEEAKEMIVKVSKNTPREPLLRWLATAGMIALLIFILLNLSLISLGLLQLRSSLKALKTGEYKKASLGVKYASSFLSLSSPVAILGGKITRSDFSKIQEAINLMTIASDTLNKLENVSKGLDREDLDRMISDGTYLYFRLKLLKSESDSMILDAIGDLDISSFISIAQVAPEILGYGSEKNYLLLFQNNGELRPTGGFIGSVGELKVKGGKMENFEIQDVYEYDGRLKVHIEPHYIIRRYLQPHLYLRDSNFDPDFQKSASMSALLYHLETGKTVNGIIAVNFEAARRLLEIIGPIELPAYNKTLDGSNAFNFLQETIDDNFFPGSSQKRDVLTAFFNQLILRLENQGAIIKTLGLIPEFLKEKHVIFAFDSPSTQSIFTSLGYAGTLSDRRKTEKEALNDFLAINEANIGVNKANINVTRETEYKISFGNRIGSQVLHSIKNGGDKEYKAYVRIFTPLGSTLKSISFDQVEQRIVPAITDFRNYEKPAFRPPQGLEVDQETVARFQAFGFIVSVPPKTVKKIEVIYDNGLALPNDAIVKYSLFIIKQPGTESYPFTLDLSYGDKFVPKEVKNAELLKDSIKAERTVSSDELIGLELIKK